MVNLANEQQPQKRMKKRRSKHPHGAPRDLQKLLEIVRLRKEGYVWREIGPRLGETSQGPYLLYLYWKDWLKEQKLI